MEIAEPEGFGSQDRSKPELEHRVIESIPNLPDKKKISSLSKKL